MSESNFQTIELEWVGRVREFLTDLARCSLAPIPQLPASLWERVRPLLEQTKVALKDAPLTPPQRQWAEEVHQLLVELFAQSLSERPHLPDNLDRRALGLSETARDIERAAKAASRSPATAEAADGEAGSQSEPASAPVTAAPSGQPPEALFEQLRRQVRIQWANSNNGNLPEWQQVLNAIDIAESLYRRTRSERQ